MPDYGDGELFMSYVFLQTYKRFMCFCYKCSIHHLFIILPEVFQKKTEKLEYLAYFLVHSVFKKEGISGIIKGVCTLQ